MNRNKRPLEGKIQDEIRMAVGLLPHCRFFRNHVGTGWHGKEDREAKPGKLVLINARKVSFGLQEGSQDLFGWVSVEITPEMVGKRIAIAAGIEVKRPGEKPKPHQENWARMMGDLGGICIVATSPEQALEELRRNIEKITAKP